MHETFAHTADVGLRVRAADLDTLFAEAGSALTSVIVSNPEGVEPRLSQEFRVAGSDLAYLLADWLAELVYAFESQRLLFCEFDAKVAGSGLCAVARGEVYDPARHVLDHEVKAVTYHGLKVERQDSGWLAEVIVDI